MATKLLKYPKKPKAKASVQVLENYLTKCKEVDKKNASRKAEAAKKATLRKKIAGIGRVK